MSKKKKNEEAIGLDVTLNKSEAFIEKHFKKILLCIAVIAVVFAAIYIYRGHRASVETEAQTLMSKSQRAFSMDQFEQALNGDGAMEKGFLKIIDEYSGTATANLAKYYAGICYYNLGKIDEAIAMLEDFDQQDDALISPASYAALGDCYVAKGDKQKGIEFFEKASKESDSRAEGGVNNSQSPQFLLKAAKIYEDLNQNDKALELYKKIKSDYASQLSVEMDKYIERLNK